MNEPVVFALEGSTALGASIARALAVPLAAHEERPFPEGEHKARPLDPVAGRDVYVVHTLYGGQATSLDDKLVRLLFFVATLRAAGARRVTAVTPYLCYNRKDRRTKPFDPLSLQYVARLLEAMGADAVITVDPHSPAAFENAFRIRAVGLTARSLFAEHLATCLADQAPVVVSPDAGGSKRARALAVELEATLGRPVPVAFVDKTRSDDVVTGGPLVGDVSGRTAVLVDDLVGTGSTMALAARALGQGGAARVIAYATHGMLVGRAAEVVQDPSIESWVVTDAVPPFRLPEALAAQRVTVLPLAPLLAEAIGRMHREEPLHPLQGTRSADSA